MLKLSKLTDYGIVVMTALAVEPQRLRNTQELAALTQVSAPTVSKLLTMLLKANLIESVRGVHGGYRLSRPPESLTVADVIDALEGPIALTQCAIHSGDCAIESNCGTRSHWRLINAAVQQALQAVNLAQMAATTAPRRDPLHDRPIQFHRASHAGANPRT